MSDRPSASVCLDPAIIPLQASHPDWIQAVQADFPAFLRDHASCEKKASGMALNVASHYPDQPRLLSAMTDLAVEELGHYREVIRIMLDRNITPGPDTKDPYVNELNGLIRRGSESFLLDRLLVGAVVERRGAERFAIVADAVSDTDLGSFYRAITASESRHWQLFIDLAGDFFTAEVVTERFNQLSVAEHGIIAALPLRAALH